MSAFMLRLIALWMAVSLCLTASAAEKVFEFNRFKLNEPPDGFRNTVTGPGKPGDWKIVGDRVLSTFPAIPGKGPEYTEQSVLGQFSQERIDDRFPLLIYDEEVFDDFVLQTRFKIIGGQDEQMAGIAFRIKNEKNYYYIRGSALGGTFAFFRVMNGQLASPVTTKVAIQTNVWHDLLINCKGNEIRASLNGQELLLVYVRDQPLVDGKLGFWTKSDSLALFDRTRITYTPKEMLAQKLINEALDTYPRVRQLKIFASRDGQPGPCVIAGNNPAEIGHPAQEVEKNVIASSAIYYGKEKDSVLVTLPFHDANG